MPECTGHPPRGCGSRRARGEGGVPFGVPIVHVDSLAHADQRLSVYANMRDAELAQRHDPLDPRAHAGVFIAEGELVLRRLIQSRFAVQSVLTTPARAPALADMLAALDPAVPVFLAPPAVLDQIVGFNMHRGVLGVGVRGPGLTFDDLLALPGPMLVLEDLVNHDNLGGVFRNAAALGGPGVSILLSPRCADPLYRKSLRVSMGLALGVPYARATQWPGTLNDLKSRGTQVWALTPNPGSVDLGDLTRGPPLRVALVLGSEGSGLSEPAFQAADKLVRIRMHPADPAVDSLNVAMAGGIALALLGQAGWIGEGRESASG